MKCSARKQGSSAVKSIFSDEIIALGKHIANAPEKLSYPRIIDVRLNEFSMGGQLAVPRICAGNNSLT